MRGIFLVHICFFVSSVFAQSINVSNLAGKHGNRTTSVIKEENRIALKLSENSGQGVVWIPDVAFMEGTVEVDIRGKDKFQKSFIGIAFNRKTETEYEVVYLRPFNFRTEDAVRRVHAIQYAAHPDFTWQRLRSEQPDKFESGIQDPPDPNDWVHLRLEITKDGVNAFVQNAKSPSLRVSRLKPAAAGSIGLWVGDGSGGDFSNLKIEASTTSSNYVNVGDAKIYYESTGNGDPVILLHGGLFGSTQEFASIIPELSSDHRVIAIATRGHAQSELGSKKLSYELYAEDFAAVIENITSEPATVVGFSDGAIAAYHLAANHPNIVKKLIAVGGPFGLSGMTEKGRSDLDEYDTPEELEKLAPEFVAKRKKMMPDPSVWYRFIQELSLMWHQPQYISPDQFRRIRCPVLIAGGDRDEYVRTEHYVEIYRIIPHAQLAIVPNAQHTVFKSHPHLMTILIRNFLSK